MPNWCYNSVTLSHEDKTKIDALEAELQKENPEPFNHLCPRPAEEEENWYGWNVNNWGTKWDITPHDWEREDDNTIYINFDSAWSPPITLYDFLDAEGWSVSAKYHEPGMGFIGAYQDGFDDYYELDWTDRESLENLPEDLADFGNVWDDLERYEEEAMEEKLAELERTEWYDVSVNPSQVGRYEVQTAAWPYPQYSNWDGEKWGRWEGDDAVITQWRGLVEEYDETEVD